MASKGRMAEAPAKAIDKAMAYLVKSQRPDGGFDSYSSPSAGNFEKAFKYQTTFVPSLILTALSNIQTPLSRRVRRRLAGFVKNQAGPSWSYNYWSKGSPELSKRPYPDDLDDTACALIGLVAHDSNMIGAEILAAFVKLLLITEQRVGGPYKTWLVPPDSPSVWQDVDLAVNANIAYLLSMVSQPLDNVTDYLEDAIRQEQLTSPYYVSAYPIIYYLSRSYTGPLSEKLRAKVQQHRLQDGRLTPLKNALLLSSLLRLGDDDIEPLVSDLLSSQQADGSWPAEAFCLDPARDGITYYNGCESLTTALAIEALQLYQQLSKPTLVDKTSLKTSRGYTSCRPAVLAAARRDCRILEPALRNSAVGFLEKLGRSSIGTEIIDLPQAFNQSLTKPLDKTHQPLLNQLGLANLYGWTAYTIIDDFLDEEGQPDLLPVGILSLRYSVAKFSEALPTDNDFQDLVWRTFDTIDGANAWELDNCRCHVRGQQLTIAGLPDYGDLSKLAERSLGHSLTPLAVLRAAGFSLDDRLFKGASQALNHYLIARQLNDDIHDWQVDLQNGHITYVVALVLGDGQIGPGNYSLSKLVPTLQQQFWHETLPRICQTIRQQTALSRQAMRQLAGLRQTNVITGLLDKIDASVEQTLAAQDQAEAFLKHYRRGEKAVSL